MDPDGPPRGKVREEAHPLGDLFSKRPLKGRSNQEVGSRKDEKKGKEGIVEKMDHKPKRSIESPEQPTIEISNVKESHECQIKSNI